MKQSTPAKDIDAYLRAVPADARAVLQRLRQQIKAAAPQAEEGISYRMPCFRQNGVLVYFAAFKDHCSFFPGGKSAVEAFREKLKGFKAEGGTIQFTPEKPLPAALVKKIVKYRMKENEARAARRKRK